ncbi:MAG: thiamine pyrophosphate-binding protein [Chloroflexi bacterium]|nr:MAG: thiamine pyrophosphate-binding protein [Chloroflexota bacterium]
MTVRVSTVAELLAADLRSRGVTRVFGLCGGHVQPVWDALDRLGVEVVDVRHECAAVYMAQAQADLGGGVGVVLATAGPGLTNTVTGLASAHLARSPVVLVAGCPPRPQSGMGALQDLPQAALIAPLCRRVETVLDRRHLLARLDAVWSAALGEEGPQGPACIEVPTDLLEEPADGLDAPRARPDAARAPALLPDPGSVRAAVDLLRGGGRVLVVTGRGARDDPGAVRDLLDATGAGHLDTAESRGVVPWDHPSQLTAVRSRAMAEAELVVTVGRRLDFQLGYGSTAVFAAEPRWLRVGRTTEEIAGNRRGDVTVQADAGAALRAMLEAGLGERAPDTAWRDALHRDSEERIAMARSRTPELVTGDGGIPLDAALGRLARPGGARLPRRRRALRRVRGAHPAGAAGDRGGRRRRARLLGDGARHRGAPRRPGARGRGEQRGLEHRAAGPDRALRREPRRRRAARLPLRPARPRAGRPRRAGRGRRNPPRRAAPRPRERPRGRRRVGQPRAGLAGLAQRHGRGAHPPGAGAVGPRGTHSAGSAYPLRIVPAPSFIRAIG